MIRQLISPPTLLWVIGFALTACDVKPTAEVQADFTPNARSNQIVRVQLIGPTKIQPGHCTQYEIAFLDQQNRFVVPDEATGAMVLGLLAGDGIYADDSCREELDPTDISIPPHHSITPAYIRAASAGQRNIFVTLDSGVFATIDVEVGDISDEPAALEITVTPNSNVVAGDTVIVLISLVNADDEPALATAGGFALTLGSPEALQNGRFCEDPDCNTPLNDSVHLPEGETAIGIFYQTNASTPLTSIDLEVGGPPSLVPAEWQLTLGDRYLAGLRISGGPPQGYTSGECSQEKVRITLEDDQGQAFTTDETLSLALFSSGIEIRNNCDDVSPLSSVLNIAPGESFVEFVVTPLDSEDFEILAIDFFLALSASKTFQVD